MDALRIPDAFITISMDKELRWLNLKCFVLNGLLYLGTILVYKAVTSMLFYSSASTGNDESATLTADSTAAAGASPFFSIIGLMWQGTFMMVRLAMDLCHYSWVMSIYIATLVLTTFWVQDIFDHLMDLKIKEI